MSSQIQSKKCMFYITGHGYGHSTRSFKTIEILLDLGWNVKIVSTVNEIFVRQNFDLQYFSNKSLIFESRKLDSGAVQIGPLELDLIGTLESYYSEIHIKREYIIEQEVNFIKSWEATLIITDVTPIACACGKIAGVTVIILSNLTWDYIYRDMLQNVSSLLTSEDHSKYMEMVTQCESDYNQCDYHFILPGPTPTIPNMDSNKLMPCPLVSRSAKVSSKKLFAQQYGHFFSTDSQGSSLFSSYILLLSFGGHDFNSFSVHDEYLPSGWICFLLGFNQSDYPNLSSRFIFFAPDVYVPDLVKVCDVFLGKIGYGTVSECLASSPVTPLIYIPRDGWPEESFLVKILDYNNAGIPMRREDFYSGKWDNYLNTSLLFAKDAQNYQPCPPYDKITSNTQLDLISRKVGSVTFNADNNDSVIHADKKLKKNEENQNPLFLVGTEASIWVATLLDTFHRNS